MKSVIFLALYTLFLMEVAILPAKVLAIFDGEKVSSMKKYPYMCGIYRNITDGLLNTACGCAIISPNYALTAALCFQEKREPNKPFTLFAGSVDFYIGQRREIFKEKDIIIHPDHDNNLARLRNANLAIVKLNPPLDCSNTIKSIRLAGVYDCIPREGKKFAITGWANNSFILENYNGYDKMYNQKLSWGEVTPENRSTCERMFERVQYDDQINICSGKTAGACIGDIGGPLAVRYSNGFVYLCGIIGTVKDKCSVYDTLYVRVSYYKDWICQNTNNEPFGCIANNSCLSPSELKV